MGRLFELRTVQISAIKVLIEALREILTETNIEFTPNGMKIAATDPSMTVLVHLFLNQDKFESYHCPNTIIAGVNVLNLFKLTKTMANNDALMLFIDERESSKLGIRIENEETNRVTTYKLNLMDLDEDSISAPAARFGSIITMPSSEFQKVCRDAFSISDVIEIRSIGQQLTFSCTGDFASQETVYGETTTGVTFSGSSANDASKVIQGYYNLKHLVLFSKCANLCQNIKMFLDNSFPVVIEFEVGSLGSLKLALAPQVEE